MWKKSHFKIFVQKKIVQKNLAANVFSISPFPVPYGRFFCWGKVPQAMWHSDCIDSTVGVQHGENGGGKPLGMVPGKYSTL